MIPTCCIPLPLGYDIWNVTKLYNEEREQHNVQVVWTLPNGRPIYVTAVADDEMLRTDEFWQTMLDRVKGYYVRKDRTNIDLKGEPNDERVSTIEDAEYERGPTTTTGGPTSEVVR